MRIVVLLLLVVLVVIIGFATYVRLAPSDPGRWHTDPAEAAPQTGHFVVKPSGGDTDGPLLQMSPAEALAAFDAEALDTPRTRRLAGAPEDGRITYVTRSRLWGFPDYTTVEATAADGGTRLLVHARLRFGQSDMGVNAQRVQQWLAAIAP